MPRIDDDLLNCVVYLYPSEADAAVGNAVGGSGVLGGVEVGDGPNGRSHLLFVVTNKHVREMGCLFARINTKLGGSDTISLESTRWFDHPDGDDITICPISLRRELHEVHYIPEGRWIDRDFMADMDIGLGEDVFSIGRVIGIDGKVSNKPTVRFGNIAQLPTTSITVHATSIAPLERLQECFVVEMRSLPGFSGSPVFVEVAKYVPFPGLAASKISKYGGVRLVASNIMLGLDFCHIPRKELVYEKPKLDNHDGSTSYFVQTNSGIAGVVPAWKINDIIENTDFKYQIEAAREAVKLEDSLSVVELTV